METTLGVDAGCDPLCVTAAVMPVAATPASTAPATKAVTRCRKPKPVLLLVGMLEVVIVVMSSLYDDPLPSHIGDDTPSVAPALPIFCRQMSCRGYETSLRSTSRAVAATSLPSDRGL